MSYLSIFCAGILVGAPKFCSQIYEKQFIQISEVKVFLAIAFKNCSTFNFYLFSKNNQNCFGVILHLFSKPQLRFDFCFTKVDAPRLRITYIHVEIFFRKSISISISISICISKTLKLFE